MPLALWAALGLGLALMAATVGRNAAQAAPGGSNVNTTQTLDDIFKKHGAAYGVDWRLLKAIATVESALNPAAVNPADPSYGLMQVLCTAGQGGKCTNRFNVDGWSEATRERLKDPDFNVKIGAQVLAWNLKTYGMPKGIAVYNAWDQRHAGANGPFKNQRYVDKVLTAYRKLGG